VRGAEKDEDISTYVKKVVFTLHESFRESVMVVDKYPFSVTRAGWGQFDILITIYFHDPNEEPVQWSHFLKLYHNQQNQNAISKKPVVFEQYDEIIFWEPTEYMHEILTGKRAVWDEQPA